MHSEQKRFSVGFNANSQQVIFMQNVFIVVFWYVFFYTFLCSNFSHLLFVLKLLLLIFKQIVGGNNRIIKVFIRINSISKWNGSYLNDAFVCVLEASNRWFKKRKNKINVQWQLLVMAWIFSSKLLHTQWL